MATKKSKDNPEVIAETIENAAAEPDLAAENADLKRQLAELRFKLAGMEEAEEPVTTEARPLTQAAPKKVKIRLPLTRAEKDDVFVALNGKTYLIKRGVDVEVPAGVAEILATSEKMVNLALEYEAQASAPLDKLEKMYQQ